MFIGLAINVAVAWSARLIAGQNPTAIKIDDVSISIGNESSPTSMSIGTVTYYNTKFDHFIIERAAQRAVGDRSRSATASTAEIVLRDAYVGTYTAGWPLRSLRYWVEYPPGSPSLLNDEDATIVGGIPLPASGDMRDSIRALAITPVFPGFLLNTLLFGGCCYLVFGAPFEFRRWLRLRNRRCPKCAYPFGTSATCTECGRDVSKWVQPKLDASPTP